MVDGALDLVPGKLSAGKLVMLGLIPNTVTQAPLHHMFKQSKTAVADAPTIDVEAAVAADEKVYITARNGATLVLKHGKKFEPLATNKLDDRLDASPALAGNQIFLRGRQFLYCISEK